MRRGVTPSRCVYLIYLVEMGLNVGGGGRKRKRDREGKVS